MKLNLLPIAILIILSCFGCRGAEVGDNAVEGVAQLQEGFAPAKASSKAYFPVKTALALQRMLTEHTQNWKLPGAVLYVASSDRVWMGAAGQADLQAKMPLKPTDRFRVANLSETFVAVICLQLAEEGTFNLDDPIADWLPADIRKRLPQSNRIKIRQLLNHTSGLPDLDREAFRQAVIAKPSHQWKAAEVLEYAFDRQSATPIGSFTYSDVDYLLLELMIERATGSSLAQAIQTRINQPLGLKNTSLELQKPDPGGLVQGYQDWNGDSSPENVTQPLINNGLGLGNRGVVSNAPDLVRFFQALFLDNTLLYPESFNQMLNLTENNAGGYGLGIAHIVTSQGEAWAQRGEALGFRSIIAYLPIHDLMIVAWTNSGDRSSDDPARLVEKSLDIILEQAP